MQLADFSGVETDLFWRLMEFHHWAHPYDEKGQRHDFAAIPKRLTQLRDDPYRSLAGEVRKAGGYARTPRRSPSSCGRISFARTSAKASWAMSTARPAAGLCRVGGGAGAQRQGALPGWSGVDAPAASRA